MSDSAPAGERPAVLLAGDEKEMVGLLPVAPDRVVTRRILKAPGAGLVRISLAEGEDLREHQAGVPVLIQVVSGHAEIVVAGDIYAMAPGSTLYVAARVRHAVHAETEAHLLLTLLEGAREPQPAQQAPASAAPASADTVVFATSSADSTAAKTVIQHHAELSGALATQVARITDAALARDTAALVAARTAFDRWAQNSLTVVFSTEASVLYPAAEDVPEGAPLVTELRANLDRIGGLLEHARNDADTLDAVAAAAALRVAVEQHLGTENARLLPLLAASPQYSLADLLAQAHGHANEEAAQPAHDPAACTCGEANDPVPELDVRTVPHAIRHATVFGALDSLTVGGAMVLVASHDPIPLLAQIQRRTPNRFAVDYLQRGPQDWKLQFTRSENDDAPVPDVFLTFS